MLFSILSKHPIATFSLSTPSMFRNCFRNLSKSHSKQTCSNSVEAQIKNSLAMRLFFEILTDYPFCWSYSSAQRCQRY